MHQTHAHAIYLCEFPTSKWQQGSGNRTYKLKFSESSVIIVTIMSQYISVLVWLTLKILTDYETANWKKN